jgi:plastocyanin
VIEFFSSGVQANANLDARLKNPDGTPKRLGLTTDQKAALVAFLRTLTDSSFLTAARFGNPFGTQVTTLPAPITPPPPTTPSSPTTPTPPPPPAPAAGAVTIQGNAFRPQTITVARGAVVTWTNLDNARHGVGFLTPGPSNTPVFTSGTQQVTMPTTPGTYNYQCLVHGAAMPGTIIVQ